MKKLLLVILFLCISTSAFAFGSITGSTRIGAMDFNVSNSVQIQVASAAVGYTVEALHLKGSRVFCTNQLNSKLYWKDVTIIYSGSTVTQGFDSVTAPSTATGAGTPDPAPSGTVTAPWAAL